MLPGNSDVALESPVAALLDEVVVDAARAEHQLAHLARVLGSDTLFGDHSV